ncbi:MAG: thiamine phosphate synthase [Gemmatimonadales bacterium]|nr:MAG: thiamine phosphate synthase [Gemmatimonadales bacterium]
MIPRLHLLTNDELLADEGLARRAAALLARGGSRLAFHLRGPRTSGRHLHDLGVALADLADASGAQLMVNDRVDVALALRRSVSGGGRSAPGVHLGGRSLPPAEARAMLGDEVLLGQSIHGEGETTGEDLDYLMVGTIYRSGSHPGREPAGPGRVERLAGAQGIPLLAVGGVTPERVGELRSAGAHGVAVIRGIWGAPDPAHALDRYLTALETDSREDLR